MGFFPFVPLVPPGALIAGALAAQTVPGNFTVNGTMTALNVVASFGQLSASLAGTGLSVRGGSNAKIGSGTLTAGTVTIADTSVTANSKVFITDTSEAGTVGTLAVSTVAGTSLTVTSSNALDTSTFNYMIVEQT